MIPSQLICWLCFSGIINTSDFYKTPIQISAFFQVLQLVFGWSSLHLQNSLVRGISLMTIRLGNNLWFYQSRVRNHYIGHYFHFLLLVFCSNLNLWTIKLLIPCRPGPQVTPVIICHYNNLSHKFPGISSRNTIIKYFVAGFLFCSQHWEPYAITDDDWFRFHILGVLTILQKVSADLCFHAKPKSFPIPVISPCISFPLHYSHDPSHCGSQSSN